MRYLYLGELLSVFSICGYLCNVFFHQSQARLGPYNTVHGKERDKVILSDLCEQILDACCAKTVSHYGKNSCDNMTIIIIWFDNGGGMGTARSDTESSVVSSSGVSSASR